jgi:hypothetical protein
MTNDVQNDVRPATQEELNQLKQYRMNVWDEDEANTVSLVYNAAIAVFPHYMSGGPGYAGKVMVVVYDGGPEYVEIYTWHQGEIACCAPPFGHEPADPPEELTRF